MTRDSDRFSEPYLVRLLQEVHDEDVAAARAWLETKSPTKSDTRVGGHTRLSGTLLARSPKNWPELELRLRAWLPSLFRAAGVAVERIEEFLGVIEKHIPIPVGAHLSNLLPVWFKEFTGVTPPADWLAEKALARHATLTVLAKPGNNESDLARTIRERVLERKIVNRPEDLLDLPGDPEAADLPPGYWVGRCKLAHEMLQDGLALLLDSTA